MFFEATGIVESTKSIGLEKNGREGIQYETWKKISLTTPWLIKKISIYRYCTSNFLGIVLNIFAQPFLALAMKRKKQGYLVGLRSERCSRTAFRNNNDCR